MSYIWMEHYLNTSQLREAFENARASNKTHLVHLSTFSNDFASVIEEITIATTRENFDQDLRQQTAYYDNIRIMNVFNTAKEFEHARCTDNEKARFQEGLNDHKNAIIEENKPFWKKILGL